MFFRKQDKPSRSQNETVVNNNIIEPDVWAEDRRTPSDAGEWREGAVVEFPSGMRVRLRPISWEMLAENGDVPEELMGVIADFIAGDEKARIPTQTLDDRIRANRLMRNVAKRMYMQPEVVDADPKAGQIAISEIEQGDLHYLWLCVNQGVQVLRAFRLESTAALLSLVTEQVLQSNAQPTAEPASEGG